MHGEFTDLEKVRRQSIAGWVRAEHRYGMDAVLKSGMDLYGRASERSRAPHRVQLQERA